MKKYILPLIIYTMSIIVCSLFLCGLLPTDTTNSIVHVLTSKSWLVNLFVFITSFYAAIKSLEKL